MYWHDGYWGMNMFWWIACLAVFAILMFWIWPRPAKRRDDAREMLRQKYAAGEISEEDYHHRLAVLAGREPPASKPQSGSKPTDSSPTHGNEPGSHSPSAA